RLLEETVGREEWDSFLREYFETYKFQSMDTERFLSLLKDSLLSEKQIADVDLHAWVYGAGLPANAPHPQSDRFQRVEEVLATFVENGSLPPADTTELWTTHEWLHFINRIPKDVTLEQLTALDKAYGFTNSGNAEILAAWFQPTIRHHYMPIYPAVEDFLIHVGRRKFLTPTYRAMKESEQLDRAREIYTKARPNYHSVSQQTMDDLLGVEG
ncbi:MAG: leukotriene A4 hydrolase C-terminal domain-containing protein, partial [Bacteroidota bacterium]|nr:leukotriene A4 hydrolase C-terminal domain-containing protein [Bacteroidota bacterium]MDX5427471.1 leukotriene A4 hydrolase C-terminal domain-containing protein [Bacteroidota bacterium]MDX5449370.1 leukotriene A4 hydrolase C-terminal domain-containing protein [Bacteroidota bacterium]MDX5505406.1 leukotriene A4 hydrolase C-terminal domain-containing protein [Bacteroidota bacterium]